MHQIRTQAKKKRDSARAAMLSKQGLDASSESETSEDSEQGDYIKEDAKASDSEDSDDKEE